jgi:hypothetical protein
MAGGTKDRNERRSGGKREHFMMEPLPVSARERVSLIPEMDQAEFNSQNAHALKEEMTYEGTRDKLVPNTKWHRGAKPGEHN